MKGPPPKPSLLRLVQGGGKMRSRFKERAKREPKPTLGLPTPPDWLTAEQLQIWRTLEANAPAGLLTIVDADLVLGYVLTLSARNAAARAWNEETNGAIVVEGRDHARGVTVQKVANPLLREMRRLNVELVAMQAQLGYSPASRTRIAVQGPKSDDGAGSDPTARFFDDVPK
jgi:P27 family predicted phage terminase small subunit